MDSITENSSESSESPEILLAPAITTVEPLPKKKTKTYGSLTTEKLSHVKSFIKKTIKDEKADRLERKELDKVAIAKMRLGVDEYDEMLGIMQKESDLSKPNSEELSEGGECDADGNGEGISKEQLDISSLRRQLANMRKRS